MLFDRINDWQKEYQDRFQLLKQSGLEWVRNQEGSHLFDDLKSPVRQEEIKTIGSQTLKFSSLPIYSLTE
jgi:hypothetical protein